MSSVKKVKSPSESRMLGMKHWYPSAYSTLPSPLLLLPKHINTAKGMNECTGDKFVKNRLNNQSKVTHSTWSGCTESPGASLVVQMVRIHLQYRRPGFDPRLSRSPEGMAATHSSILACRILWTGIPGGRGAWWATSPWGHTESAITEQLTHTHTEIPTHRSDFQA